MLILTDSEASTLMDACALIVLATDSCPEAALPPGMATLLSGVFSGLKTTNAPTSI